MGEEYEKWVVVDGYYNYTSLRAQRGIEDASECRVGGSVHFTSYAGGGADGIQGSHSAIDDHPR
jgi:hypothetical protein